MGAGWKAWWGFACLLAAAGSAAGQQTGSPDIKPDIHITRIAPPIVVDGDLSDEGWKNAAKVDTFFETNPGDNVPPKVRTVAYLGYDDKYFYAGFEFFDPDPSKIRAPYGDRDDVSSATDYGGVILDTRNDRRTGLLLLANPRGIQYDAISDDTTGNEDSSPDYYWDSAAKITAQGWVLEIRVPLSSLRYPPGDKQAWGILLYRNYPRDFRYQMFSATLPKGGNCFICRSNALIGLENLPPAGHLVVAPYGTAKEDAVPRGDLGSDLVNKPIRLNGGIDAKWTPNENNAIDGTLNPDFSQVESDVAQIAVNQRFALFYPEKRPFFLEGLELFSTPIQAVYTRSITSPRWGLRATGKLGAYQYTGFISVDRGGGSVILPGPNGSSFAEQDFSSFVGMARLRRDFGKSFVSFLATDREVNGGGYNRVYGPDFQWRHGETDTVTGQLLFSNTENPNRPDLTPQWTGQRLNSHAGDIWYSHSTRKWDWFTEYKDIGNDFRADNGFVPQVGYREYYGEAAYTIRPVNFPISRVRFFIQGDYQGDRDNETISQSVSPGFALDGMWNSFVRIRYADDKVRSGDELFPRKQVVYTIQFSPSYFLSGIVFSGTAGEQVDFDNHRPGTGADVNIRATVRPTNHLKLDFVAARSWVDVDPGDGGGSRRLFTADVGRIKATYTFTARAFLRLIGQLVQTRRDPSLYTFEVAPKDAAFTGSALFAYKVNWQTVLFLGYGDNRVLLEDDRYARAGHQFFLKVSYAFQK